MANQTSRNPYRPPEGSSGTLKKPGDSFAKSSTKTVVRCIENYIWVMPLVNYVYVWIFWLFTSLLLGEWARPGVHDPKDVLGGVPHYAHIALLILSLGILPVVLSCGFARNRFRGLAYYLIAFLSSLAVSVFLFRLDLWQMTSWISD